MKKTKKDTKAKKGDLRVWWIPQVPGKPFHVPVRDIREAGLVLDTLGKYDIFQLENRIKPDFSNTGGLQIFAPDKDADDGDGWVDWYDPETDLDIDDYLREHMELH